MERRAVWMLGLALLLGACRGDVEETARALTGGEPQRAPHLIQKYGCGTCHNIPGVDGARGQVGPPLDTIASRSYLAGQLPNTPENLMLWIRKPQDVQPGTAMPDVGVTEQDGRDIAAYLYTLR
ncbi:MAG TPA: c-type cytochrome [Thermoanaerobaculia bacterium]|nr:c-type cytochrome [Thermoanaerobaculia bacterium]HSN89372.1 c-type cytochrome [Thermoanaerobaculia bacterium]